MRKYAKMSSVWGSTYKPATVKTVARKSLSSVGAPSSAGQPATRNTSGNVSNCPGCGKKFRYPPALQAKCPKCGRVFPINKSGQYMPVWTGVSGLKENVTGFGYDATGRLVGINEKGKRVDPRDTRYDVHNDPRGWKTAGKKVREKDKHGNPNN